MMNKLFISIWLRDENQPEDWTPRSVTQVYNHKLPPTSLTENLRFSFIFKAGLCCLPSFRIKSFKHLFSEIEWNCVMLTMKANSWMRKQSQECLKHPTVVKLISESFQLNSARHGKFDNSFFASTLLKRNTCWDSTKAWEKYLITIWNQSCYRGGAKFNR